MWSKSLIYMLYPILKECLLIGRRSSLWINLGSIWLLPVCLLLIAFYLLCPADRRQTTFSPCAIQWAGRSFNCSQSCLGIREPLITAFRYIADRVPVHFEDAIWTRCLKFDFIKNSFVKWTRNSRVKHARTSGLSIDVFASYSNTTSSAKVYFQSSHSLPGPNDNGIPDGSEPKLHCSEKCTKGGIISYLPAVQWNGMIL